jgi:hypothetical protein
MRYIKTSFSDDDLSQLEWVLDRVFGSLKDVNDHTKSTIRRGSLCSPVTASVQTTCAINSFETSHQRSWEVRRTFKLTE